jgi:hypothetical protein
MESVSARGLIVVAAIQAAIAATALLASPAASAAAAAIGILAVGRYFSLSLFARAMAPGSDRRIKIFATSAWLVGFAALLAVVAAVAVRSKPALPWAVAAAFAGPVGMSAIAFASGLGTIVTNRRAARAGGAR